MKATVFGTVAMALGLAMGSPAAAEATLVTDVTLVDVESGTLSKNQSILIDDGMIVETGPALRADGAAVFNAAGRFLIPGLWDSHVHVFSSKDEPGTAFPLYLIHGITGIRDMGALRPIAA